MSKTKLSLKSVLKDLVADKIVAPADAEKLLLQNRNKDETVHPLIIISQQELKDQHPPHKPLTLELLTLWLANKVKLPYVRIDPLKVDVTSVTAVMAFAYADRNKILAIHADDKEVVIATADPLNTAWESGLKQITNRQIKKVVANPQDISRFLGEFYNLSQSVQAATGKNTGSHVDINNLEQLLELGRADKPDANDQYIVNIVDWLLQYAFDQRASDIHLEPRRDKGNIRFRIDGILQQVYEMPPAVMLAVTARLKTLGRMDIAEKRRPLDGRLKTKSPEGKEVELRLSTMPTAFGEKMVMRIFDPSILFKSFSELGLHGEDFEKWQHIISHPTGIVLVTGPTGSGKTTTLYSTLKRLANPEVNVCTIEDPIEMIEPSFNQMQVQQSIDLDFASGVKALLRQDPDIIMIGEIRDYETAQNAIQAALTGHLVISTLHTNDASSAVTRLIEVGMAPYLISATVLGVMAQRLIRTLCPHCKRKSGLDPNAWNALVHPFKTSLPEVVYTANGCSECRNTGYQGRIGVYEIITMNQVIRRMIKPNCEAAEIRAQAVKDGTILLRLNGARKVAEGVTTIEEVLRVTPHLEED